MNHRILLLVMSIPVLAGCQQNKCAINVKQENEIQPTVGLKIKHGIKVVYQIKTDDKKEGVGAGLYYVKKLIDTYQDLNISENDRDVHAVFHGDAGYWMLKDKPYENETNSSVNPNKKIIDELLANGVKLELCASTMKSHNWTKEDIVDGITIVVGAYPRIIDLQMRGYEYIRF